MPQFPAVSNTMLMFLMLGGAALILYAAGRIAIGAVPSRIDRSSTRAVLGAIPVLMVAIVGVLAGRPNMALHLPVACAAATLTFGLAALLAARQRPDASSLNRSWALIVPAIAILFIAVLGGKLDPSVLVALALYGFVVLRSWSDDPIEVEVPHPAQPEQPGPAVESMTSPLALTLWVTALIAAVLAGVMGMYGTQQLERVTGRTSDALVTVFLLAPAIVVPFFFEMLPPCRSLGWGGSISSLLKFGLICICFVLPIAAVLEAHLDVVLAAWAMPHTFASTMPASQPVAAAATFVATYPSLPAIAARADLVILVGVSLLLIPLSSGLIKTGRYEALALLLCYVANLLFVMASSM